MRDVYGGTDVSLIAFTYKVDLELRSYGYLMRWYDADGNRKSKSAETRSKRKAKERANKKELLLNSGMNMDIPTRPTFDDLMKEIRKTLGPGAKKTYFQTRSDSIRQLRKFTGSHLDKVNVLAVMRFRAKVRSKNCARTWNKHLANLQALFNTAMEWGYVDTNVFTRIRKDPAPEQEIRYVTDEEEATMMTACRTIKDKMIILLARYGGLRATEISRLHVVEDIDRDSGRIDIRNRTDAITKTSARRSVYLGDARIPLLKRFVQESRKRNGRIYGDFPFYARQGNLVSRRFCTLKGYAGINGFRLQDLRKTCATEMLYDGVPLKTVADFLGHSVKVLMRIYASVLTDRMKEARDMSDSKRVSEGC